MKQQYGSVILSESIALPDGHSVQIVTGLVSVGPAIDALGFAVSRAESNWFAMIEGERATVYIPGCCVSGIVLHPPDVFTGAEVYRVP